MVTRRCDPARVLGGGRGRGGRGGRDVCHAAFVVECGVCVLSL